MKNYIKFNEKKPTNFGLIIRIGIGAGIITSVFLIIVSKKRKRAE